MTAVLIDLRAPTPEGVDVGTPGMVECVPNRRTDEGGYVRIPGAFTAPLVGGVVLVDLAPTAPGACWRITEVTRVRHTRYVLVPDSPTPVRYTDLVDVDPATLTPTPEALAGWDAAMAEFRAIRDDIMQAVTLLNNAAGGPNA